MRCFRLEWLPRSWLEEWTSAGVDYARAGGCKTLAYREKLRVSELPAPSAGPAAPAERGSIRKDNRALTRKRIISAARSLFVDRNYIATTIDDIAEAAEIGRATFYLHFESKDEVLQAVLEEGMDQQLALFRKLADMKEPSRPALRKWVEQYFNAYKSHYASLRLFMFVIGLESRHIGVFSKNRDRFIALLGESHPAFRLPAAGPERELRRVAAHRQFYRIEQLASFLAGPGTLLDRATCVDCATDGLQAYLSAA